MSNALNLNTKKTRYGKKEQRKSQTCTIFFYVNVDLGNIIYYFKRKQTNIDDYLKFENKSKTNGTGQETLANQKSQDRCCSIPDLLTAAAAAASAITTAAATTTTIMNSSSLTKVEASKFPTSQQSAYTTTVIDTSTLKRTQTNHMNHTTLQAKQMTTTDPTTLLKQQTPQHTTSYSYCASKPQTMLFRSPSINNVVQDNAAAAAAAATIHTTTIPMQNKSAYGIKKSYSNAGQINYQSPTSSNGPTTCYYHPYEYGAVSAPGHQKPQNGTSSYYYMP